MNPIIVHNYSYGDTRWFSSLDKYKEYATNGGYGNGYSPWNDEVFQPEEGHYIYDCEQLDLYDFKNSLTND
jgi:hypothetical protein